MDTHTQSEVDDLYDDLKEMSAENLDLRGKINDLERFLDKIERLLKIFAIGWIFFLLLGFFLGWVVFH